jgi:hypothetical protein
MVQDNNTATAASQESSVDDCSSISSDDGEETGVLGDEFTTQLEKSVCSTDESVSGLSLCY